MNTYITGFLAGNIATIIVQPLDKIKVMIQLKSYDIVNKPKSIKELGLYKGIDYAIMRQSVYGTLRLGMFQDLKDKYGIHPIKSAIISASIATIVNNPIDYLLLKKQTHLNFNIQHELMNNPIKTYYKGLFPNIMRAIGINIGFGSKTILEKEYNKYYDSKLSQILSICSASLISTIAGMPFDTLRTYQQKDIAINYKNIKLFDLYRSYPIFAFRIIPHSFISLYTIDILNNLYRKYKL